jgi:hypothetical protein
VRTPRPGALTYILERGQASSSGPPSGTNGKWLRCLQLSPSNASTVIARTSASSGSEAASAVSIKLMASGPAVRVTVRWGTPSRSGSPYGMHSGHRWWTVWNNGRQVAAVGSSQRTPEKWPVRSNRRWRAATAPPPDLPQGPAARERCRLRPRSCADGLSRRPARRAVTSPGR